jgi:hypothetical protein
MVGEAKAELNHPHSESKTVAGWLLSFRFQDGQPRSQVQRAMSEVARSTYLLLGLAIARSPC